MPGADKSYNLRPFLLKPAGQDYLWGGRRLKDDFCKDLPMTPLAETWECSTHPDGESSAFGGAFDGMKLSDVLKSHPEMMGTHPASQSPEDAAEGRLPILVKFIDAAADLSVQVHPSDEYAAQYENGQRGKTEMWYVVDASRDASLIYGFARDMERDLLEDMLRGRRDGLEECLLRVPVRKDDVFFIEAGTVHAVGAGSLIVEVQESSNLTYRMYDYHRVGKDGKERQLHIDKALAVASLKKSTSPRQPMRVLRYRQGYASEFLCRCRYFEVERVLLNTERMRSMAGMKASASSFEVLVCTRGCGAVIGEDYCIPFCQGDTFFVPAGSDLFRIHGKAELLRVRC